MKSPEDNVETLQEEAMFQEQISTSSLAWEEIAAARRITFEDIKTHMTGPVLSICLHIILITMLMTLIVSGPKEDPPEYIVNITDMVITPVEKLPEVPPEEDTIPSETPDVESPTKSPSSDAPSESQNVAKTEEFSNGYSETPDARMLNIPTIATTSSPVVVPGVMSRRSKPGREGGLRDGGAPKGTEDSLLKGLRWLRDHQNDDGSWGEDPSRKPAFTGFAILAFLGHDETPSSAEFGACVLKGIKKLLEYSESSNPVQTCAGNGYGHAIVTYALSEAYGMTRMQLLETAVNKMIDYTVKGQNAVGGFNYGYNNAEGRCDLSVMGWANQAIKAAHAAGSTTPNLEAAMEKAVQCIKTQQRDSGSGGFVYSTNIGAPGGGATNNVTAVGILCLQLLGDGKSPEVAGGLKYLKEKCFAVSWDRDEAVKNGGVEWALYRWYYQTQVFFQNYGGKGPEWMAWNKMFAKTLIKNQKPDGHWESPAYGIELGKGQVEQFGEGQFKGVAQGIYSTALCCLMLEVYYRYLPTFKVVSSASAAPAGKNKDTDGLIFK